MKFAVSRTSNFHNGDKPCDNATILRKNEWEETLWQIKNYLSTRTDKEPPLFVGQLKPHGRLSTSFVGKLLRDLGRKCGIEKVHPHRFRRTCATMALHRGMPIDQVRLMLGHESIETTTIYAEESMDVVKQSHAKYM